MIYKRYSALTNRKEKKRCKAQIQVSYKKNTSQITTFSKVR